MTKKTHTSGGDSSSKLDRKTIEKNRRIHMKALCLKLSSIVPPNYIKLTKDIPSQLDQLDVATAYIKDLRERISALEAKKEEAMNKTTARSRRNEGRSSLKNNRNNKNDGVNGPSASELVLPLVEIRDLGSDIEVMMVSGLNNKNFMLYEVIAVLEEEGAEVVAANYSLLPDKIFYTLHAQVKLSRVGVDTRRVYERIQELIAPVLAPLNWDLLEEPHYYQLPSCS